MKNPEFPRVPYTILTVPLPSGGRRSTIARRLPTEHLLVLTIIRLTCDNDDFLYSVEGMSMILGRTQNEGWLWLWLVARN